MAQVSQKGHHVKLFGQTTSSTIQSISIYSLSKICSLGLATLVGYLYSIMVEPTQVRSHYALT